MNGRAVCKDFNSDTRTAMCRQTDSCDKGDFIGEDMRVGGLRKLL